MGGISGVLMGLAALTPMQVAPQTDRLALDCQETQETAEDGIWSYNNLLEELSGMSSICVGKGAVRSVVNP